jgi:hypothetical protein
VRRILRRRLERGLDEIDRLRQIPVRRRMHVIPIAAVEPRRRSIFSPAPRPTFR